MSKFKPYRKDQIMLLPSCVNDYVPETHLARVVDQIVEKLDTRPIENKYSDRGQHTYHPKIFIKLLFYGYASAERSGRVIAHKCESDCAYMYLAQMYTPDFRTINAFRKNHLKELSGYFVDIVRYCQEIGLVQVGQINIDGTKMRANAANHNSKTKEQYEKSLKAIDETIEKILQEAADTDQREDEQYGNRRGDELPEELNSAQKLKIKLEEISKKFTENPKRINSTDEDAVMMKTAGAGYNCQAAVTNDQVIVAAEVLTDTNDKQALEVMVKSTQAVLDQKLTVLTADSGYASFDNFEYLSKNDYQGYIPDQDFDRLKNNKLSDYDYEHFIYNDKNNTYMCPQGQSLKPFRKKNANQGYNATVYRADYCPQCPAQQECAQHEYRTITREQRRPLVDEMRQRLSTPEGKQIYQKRLHTCEPVFGNIKHNLGYRRFHLRTLPKVNGEFKLMCIGHNIKKIFHLGIKFNMN